MIFLLLLSLLSAFHSLQHLVQTRYPQFLAQTYQQQNAGQPPRMAAQARPRCVLFFSSPSRTRLELVLRRFELVSDFLSVSLPQAQPESERWDDDATGSGSGGSAAATDGSTAATADAESSCSAAGETAAGESRFGFRSTRRSLRPSSES